jgi:exonuclease III
MWEMKLSFWNVQLLHAAGDLKMLTDVTDRCEVDTLAVQEIRLE